MLSKRTYPIAYLVNVLSMIFWINYDVLACLEYPRKRGRLHQGRDYIAMMLHWLQEFWKNRYVNGGWRNIFVGLQFQMFGVVHYTQYGKNIFVAEN